MGIVPRSGLLPEQSNTEGENSTMKWFISFVIGIMLLCLSVRLVQPVSNCFEKALDSESAKQFETAGLWDESALTAVHSGNEAAAAEKQTEERAAEETVSRPPVQVHVNPVDEYSCREEKIIMLGDSRTVCLYCSMIYSAEEFPSHVFYHIAPDYTGTYEDTVFVAKGGEGYAWFSSCSVPLAQQHMDSDSVIVIWFGVNDLGAADRYINYINTTLLQYDVPVYYMTVGPCDQHWSDKNPEVDSFNAALQAGLDEQVKIIDMHGFIQEGMDSGAFATMDGLHYNYETCRAVYQHLVETIREDMQE